MVVYLTFGYPVVVYLTFGHSVKNSDVYVNFNFYTLK